MALDGIFLRHIKHEIENEILGSRVNQIYQPNRDELVLVLRSSCADIRAAKSSCYRQGLIRRA